MSSRNAKPIAKRAVLGIDGRLRQRPDPANKIDIQKRDAPQGFALSYVKTAQMWGRSRPYTHWREKAIIAIALVRHPTSMPLYISRQPAREFLEEFAEALQAPESRPVLFNAWGIGGIGKSTLVEKLQDDYQQQAQFAVVSFGQTEGIETPLKLMAKLYDLLPKPGILQRDLLQSDPFTSLYDRYQDTLKHLETKPVPGKKAVDAEQIKQVKQLLNMAAQVGAKLASASDVTAPTFGKIAEKSVDAAVTILSLKDSVQDLLQQHQATKRDRELQELMLEPLPKLTQAFARGLIQRSRKRPVVLVLDTYEKATPDFDLWLWRSLLANTDVKFHKIRIVVAGRRCLLETESWSQCRLNPELLCDRQLNLFDERQTQDYLEEIDINSYKEVEAIYQATKGLPYYLNWIKREKESGRAIDDFWRGNQQIVELLLQGLNDAQKTVVQIAACCRWFDSSLIQHLINSQELDFQKAADETRNGFEWLKQQDFVEFIRGFYRLDDVARDAFRLSLYQEDRQQFYRIHALLASYFERQANEIVPSDRPLPDSYENAEWRDSTAEFLYHACFMKREDFQHQFISHLFASCYLARDEVVKIPFTAIAAEFDLAEHPLLSEQNRKFLSAIKPIVEVGSLGLEEESIELDDLASIGFSKDQIETALNVCFSHINSLEGLAKFAALLYKSKRCPENQRLEWLQQAQEQAERIATNAAPEFSSDLFLWDLGNALYYLGQFEEALASYEKALEFKPDKHEAWNNRGMALKNLGQFEEALASYEKALEFKPDLDDARYNKACCYALQNNIESAIENLQQAILLNPDEYREHAKTDSDLDSIRGDDRFRALLRESAN